MNRPATVALIALAACSGHGDHPAGLDGSFDQLDVATDVGTDAPVDASIASSLVVAPATLDFGTIAAGAISLTATVTITFTGPPGSAVTQVLGGANPSSFAIDGTTCTTLSSNQSCTTRLRFTPASVGPSTASLSITAGTAQATVSLRGTGTATASLQILPSVHDYGAVAVGAMTTRAFTLTNATGAATGALATSITGSDASQFAKGADSCSGATLAPNQTCMVTVSFAPTSTGAKSASLQIAGTPGGGASAGLTGAGASTGSLVITPATFDFGSVSQGNSSLGTMFTITNNGSATTGVLATSMGGDHPGDFLKQFDQCQNHTLGPGQACTLFITFEPGPVGPRNARVQVAASPGGFTAADLSGTCTP